MTDTIEPPHPRTVAFWVSRVLLAGLIGLLGWSGWRVASHIVGGGTDRLIRDTDKTIEADKIPKPPKPFVYDAAWARGVTAEIAAVDSEIQAAKEAYDRHEASAAKRTISREDDRREGARLNQVVLDLQRKRAEAAARLAAHQGDAR